MSREYAVQVESVVKCFGTVEALKTFSTTFEAGQLHGLIGPEGAGKTTLMRQLVGLMKPNSGSIQYQAAGRPLPYEQVRDQVAYMPQQQSLYSDLTVSEHLDFFRELYGIEDRDYRSRRGRLLEITRLGNFVDRRAGQLSGGMYKKLGLMCALLRAPEVLILDEPTNGVDPISRRELWELLYQMMEERILIIVSTAYMDEAERCGKVHLMQDGRLIAAGEPGQVLEEEKAERFDELFLRFEREAKGS